MAFEDAMDLVDDDLPDGAFWAMAHEIAGLEYGDGFDELVEGTALASSKPFTCEYCAKPFRSERAREDHRRGKHAKRLAREAQS